MGIVNQKTPVHFFNGDSPEASEFRRLLMRIRTGRNPESGAGYRSFLITSATRGEGKTTLASYLAVTFARFDPGLTLLLDGDMRRSNIHNLFQLKRKPGLSDILTAMKEQDVDASSTFGFSELLASRPELEGCLRDSGLDNLKILTSGSSHTNPSEIIEKKGIRALLSDLSRSFDNIIIDSPPAVPVVDPLILGSEADATLLVVMAGQTPREVVLRAKDLLVNGGVNLLGLVANDVKSALPYYYDYKYYKYYHPGTKARGKH